MRTDTKVLSDSADRPTLSEPEIEVTPEMIEAGVKAFRLFDSGDLPEWIVEAVFVDMSKARALGQQG